MAGSWTTMLVLDGGASPRTMRVWDESGVGTGPFSFGQIIGDGSGAGNPNTAIQTGVAGVASAQVLTVQGVASMTPLQDNITQLGGNAISLGLGATAAGTPRVTLANDSVGIIPTGPAGTPATTVLTIQGIAGGTPIPVTPSSDYPVGAVPITASATGTTAATTATLAGTAGKTTYLVGFSIRANATAAATGNATVTGPITGTLNFTQFTAPLASGLGILEPHISKPIPASAANIGIAVVSAAPGAGGTVSVSAWGYQL